MSTDPPGETAASHRDPGAGRIRILRAPASREAPDAAEVARTLTEKYGAEALAFARGRAARAKEIGDELALDSWRRVIEATRLLLAG